MSFDVATRPWTPRSDDVSPTVHDESRMATCGRPGSRRATIHAACGTDTSPPSPVAALLQWRASMEASSSRGGPGPTTLVRSSGPHARPTADRPFPADLCFPACHSTVLGPQPSLPAVGATVPAFWPRLHLGHPTERDRAKVRTRPESKFRDFLSDDLVSLMAEQ